MEIQERLRQRPSSRNGPAANTNRENGRPSTFEHDHHWLYACLLQVCVLKKLQTLSLSIFIIIILSFIFYPSILIFIMLIHISLLLLSFNSQFHILYQFLSQILFISYFCFLLSSLRFILTCLCSSQILWSFNFLCLI